MRLVIIESPYAGDIGRNTEYARAALADSLSHGEAPIASHLLYTQPGVLDDTNPAERALGIAAGLAWGELAEATIVYDDLGVSPGMGHGIDRARRAGRPVEYRSVAITPAAALAAPEHDPATVRAVLAAVYREVLTRAFGPTKLDKIAAEFGTTREVERMMPATPELRSSGWSGAEQPIDQPRNGAAK